MDRVRQIAAGIAASVGQQGAATQEIARSVQQASQGTQQVSRNIGGVTQAATAAGQVLAAAGDLTSNSDMLRAEIANFLAKVRAA